jgi:hypothetical protein
VSAIVAPRAPRGFGLPIKIKVLIGPSCGSGVFWASVKMTIIRSACAKTTDNCFRSERTRIRLSRLLLGDRNRRFQACVACQPQRPQSGGLFPGGRTGCLVFGHCLLSLSQLLFLFLKSRFGAVTRPFNVGIQCRYSFSTKSARRTDFLPEERMRAADVGCSTDPTPFQVICSAHTEAAADDLAARW